MANLLYQEMLKKSVQRGLVANNTKSARKWFREQAMEVGARKAKGEIKSELVESRNSAIRVGKMYMFGYDPKTKDDLPYYDKFPLIFPFEKVKGGFMGINMHYLPHTLRAKLMDALYTLVSDDKYDTNTQLQGLSYGLLKSASRFRYFKPCVKHYLNSHVTSRFLYVHPRHWDMALFLPLEQFRKANKETVYQDSIDKIKRT